jgi:L-iditol 2-dehydrogenase
VRVAVYYNNHDVRIEERPRPVAGPGEMVIRIETSGICGSDVMEWYRVPKAPTVLGHEFAGRVEEIGTGVTRFHVGERVMATHHVPCNACRYCLTGRESVCDTLRRTTIDPGGFSEYARLPALNVDRGTFSLPEEVGNEEATFVEPLACAVRGQRIARMGAGWSLAVLGSGVAGILHIQLARARGARRIFATDVHPFRLEAARRMGADRVLDAREDVPEGIRKENGGRLADLVVVCTGAIPAITQAFRCVDRGGTILLYAPPAPGVTLPVPLHDLWKDGITLVHSYAAPPADLLTALDLIAARRVEVARLVTHRFGLTEVGEAFRIVAAGADSLKVLLNPHP